VHFHHTISSVVKVIVLGHVGELAFAESASHELLGDGVNISMLFHEHLVHVKVSKAKLVEILEGLLERFVGKIVDLLVVDLLGSLDINADHALHQSAGLLIFIHEGQAGFLLLSFDNWLSHLFVSGNFLLLGDHLDRSLADNWLHHASGEIFVENLRLLWLDTKDIAVDLVAKLNSSSLKTEEGGVASFLSRCFALDRNFESLSRGNLVLEGDD